MSKLVKPKKIGKGSTLGIVGPSSPLPNIEKLDLTVRKLEQLGYKVKLGDSTSRAYGYLAATDDVRANDLNRMFADAEVDAVVAMRGGYGAMRILDKLDYSIARENPKVLIGFSDVTALHAAYMKYADLVAFHAPMPVGTLADGEMEPIAQDAFDRALKRAEPMGVVPSAFPLTALARGKAEGMLVGGNLCLQCGILGTPYELDAKGCILFIEETGESVYSVDRLLTQLRLAGKFEDCAGIVIGDFDGCDAAMRGHNLTMEQVLADILPKNKPIIRGYSIGHCTPNIALPLGVMARIDADNTELTILENAVI
ncbi:MAG: LD-carboxypeptidase [Oscillospiraceae bacterium]|jgi:muramoyltetrapeptide carboxypeptidase|nr:LD-carboxypeptidase [Oscillospiraceae bacterium]